MWVIARLMVFLRYAAMAKQVDEINVMAHGPQEYLRAVVLPPNSM